MQMVEHETVRGDCEVLFYSSSKNLLTDKIDRGGVAEDSSARICHKGKGIVMPTSVGKRGPAGRVGMCHET
jgi:hypothetical protein